MTAYGTFPTRRDVRLESGMRVKPDVTASLWGCPLGEQLSAEGEMLALSKRQHHRLRWCFPSEL